MALLALPPEISERALGEACSADEHTASVQMNAQRVGIPVETVTDYRCARSKSIPSPSASCPPGGMGAGWTARTVGKYQSARAQCALLRNRSVRVTATPVPKARRLKQPGLSEKQLPALLSAHSCEHPVRTGSFGVCSPALSAKLR